MTTPYTTTTRLTRTDQPTGFEKVAQDNWDKIREKQVRGYEDRTGASAFRSFCEAVQRGAEMLINKPADDKMTMCCALGSYNILDGGKGKVIDTFQDNVSKLHHRKFPSAVNDFLVSQSDFVFRTPVDCHFRLVSQTFFEKLQKYPLRPFVIFRISCINFPRPVKRNT